MSIKRIVILEIEDLQNDFTNKLISFISEKDEANVLYDSSYLKFDDLCIYEKEGRVQKKNRHIKLTVKELKIILLLSKHPGWVYSREQIYEFAWGDSNDNYIHAVENMISRIRKKIEDDPLRPKYIITVNGLGYKFMNADISENKTTRKSNAQC